MNKIVYGQPAQDYHRSSGLNKSSVDLLLNCPLAYRLARDGLREKETPSMKLGTIFHCMVLEPERFDAEYHVMQNPGNIQAGKKEKAAAEAEGKECISKSDWEKAKAMSERLFEHDEIRRILAMPGNSEVSLYWELQKDGQPPRQCKARVDFLAETPEGYLVVDLKTVSGDPDCDNLSRHVADYAYHRQQAWYKDGMKCLHEAGVLDKPCLGFVFLFSSTTPPHLCTAVSLDEKAENQGLSECYKAEGILTRCEKSGKWPSYYPTTASIGLPEWYYKAEARKGVVPEEASDVCMAARTGEAESPSPAP